MSTAIIEFHIAVWRTSQRSIAGATPNVENSFPIVHCKCLHEARDSTPKLR